MIKLKEEGFDKESLDSALENRKIKKMIISTSKITIYSLCHNNMADSREWLFKRIDSSANDRLNDNQKLPMNKVSSESLPIWARISVLKTGFFISVSTEDDEMQFFVEQNCVSTLTKFLNMQGRAMVKHSLARDILLKNEMDEQDISLSLIYREEKRINGYGEKTVYRSVVAIRNTHFEVDNQLANLKTAVAAFEKRGAVVNHWMQDPEKLSVRMIFPQVAEDLFQKKYSLPEQIVPCITLRESETGDAAFRMNTAVVLLTGTQETRQNAGACTIGELVSGKAKTTLELNARYLESVWGKAYAQFDDFASMMHAMKDKRISPDGNPDDDGTWTIRNRKQLREFIDSAVKLCDLRKAVGTKRRDEIEKRLMDALDPKKVYTAADIAVLFLKIPGWIRKNKCNDAVCDNAAENAAKIVTAKEAA